MKKNNKGFMLAEVVVTSALLLTMMIGLFYTFNRTYTRYETISKYKNIDGMYILQYIMEYMYNDINNDNINKIIQKKENKEYYYLIENKVCKLTNNKYCEKLKETYNINNLVIVNEIKEDIRSLKDKVTNQTFKDYIDYIEKYYPLNDYTKDSYLVIVEYNLSDNENEYNYSSLELR